MTDHRAAHCPATQGAQHTLRLPLLLHMSSALMLSTCELTWTLVCAQVNLKREKLELSPVYSTAVDHDGHKLGYIRLVNFGQHAALDMQHAVQKLQACSLSCGLALQQGRPCSSVPACKPACLSLSHMEQM